MRDAAGLDLYIFCLKKNNNSQTGPIKMFCTSLGKRVLLGFLYFFFPFFFFKVELLVMKALSVGLVKGSIDEVDKRVHMTWVQPRVLDLQQVTTRWNAVAVLMYFLVP